MVGGCPIPAFRSAFFLTFFSGILAYLLIFLFGCGLGWFGIGFCGTLIVRGRLFTVCLGRLGWLSRLGRLLHKQAIDPAANDVQLHRNQDR